MDKRDSTPEKELLRIIENPSAKTKLASATMRYQRQSLFSWDGLKGRLAFFRKRLHSVSFEARSLYDIENINLALSGLVFFMALALILNSFFSFLRLRKGLDFKLEHKSVPVISQDNIQRIKGLSYYLEKTRQRDIFRMNTARTSTVAPLRSMPSERIVEATQNYRLVGISWSDDPDVMIEDTKTQRTFFLKKGQTIENNIRLQAVFKDKVVLSLDGEEITLR